ncbi:MAG: redoxin domain-containing protein [Rhizobiales bacterium]|nr:redoxin domain-containing protein [Hyphomicrobiales bacterium]
MTSLIGSPLPYTDLPSTHGGVINPARLRGLSVIFCYPWTGRPGVENPPNWDLIPGAHGSTPQAQAYAQLHPSFLALNAQIFGISFQEPPWQSEFAIRCSLPFPLLSDADHIFANALRLETFRTGGEDYLKRITLIARDGTIIAARDTIPDPATDAPVVLKTVEGLEETYKTSS